MPTLSLAMIVRNEAARIERVLSCARQFCDEMIVVDTGSTDNTVELAQKMGATVHHFAWINDFAAARNFSFSKATGDWILWLDADDWLDADTIEIGKRIKSELLEKCATDVVFCPYDYAQDEQGQNVLMQRRERFIRRSAGLRWVGRIHECIDQDGSKATHTPEFVVRHDNPPSHAETKKGRNLSIFESYIDIQTATHRELYLYGGELRAAGRLEDSARVYERYLETWPHDQYDLFEEPYIVCVDLCETYRQLKDYGAAMRVAGRGIAFNPARAECYALAGLTHSELGSAGGAFPLFLAAAACRPPTHGGLIYSRFYDPAILRPILDETKKALESANGMVAKP